MAPRETRTSLTATVTDEVRGFYESHPYPAPIADLDRHRELYRNPHRRRALSLLLWPTERQRANREILVAGCGTSQAAKHAMREPDARITAIDISETSLGYTRDLQQRYGLQNLNLHRLAIEQIGELGQMFDQIVCTGVLHHLSDPDLGLRVLRSVLAPGGAMQLMVYAAYGRAGIYMMREYCHLLGVGSADSPLAAVAEQARAAFIPVKPIGMPRSMLWGLSVPLVVVASRLGLFDMPAEAYEAAAAELEGWLARRYLHRRTGVVVHVLLLCGRPGPLSVHTPEVCYYGQRPNNMYPCVIGYSNRGPPGIVGEGHYIISIYSPQTSNCTPQ